MPGQVTKEGEAASATARGKVNMPMPTKDLSTFAEQKKRELQAW